MRSIDPLARGAQLSTDTYVAFKENVSISDMALPTDPALKDKAFVVEDDGTVRIIETASA